MSKAPAEGEAGDGSPDPRDGGGDRDRKAAGGVALLVIDMINPLDFQGGENLKPNAHQAARAIASLRDQADAAGVPTIYVNDNYGRWRDDRSVLLDMHLKPGSAASKLAEHIRPRERDLFVIKPAFSGFYATNLPVLLPKLGADRLVLTGVAADICVLFTAADAHMRDYRLWTPEDAVASEHDQRKNWALEIMRNSMNAETRATSELKLGDWVDRRG